MNLNFKKILKSRKFQYGSLSTLLTAGFILVVILINIIGTLLVDKFSLKLDLTSQSIYKLSSDTVQVLNKLNTDVTIMVSYEETTYPSQFKETLSRIAQKSNHIKLKYVDPDKNPTSTLKYSVDYTVERGAVIVESSKRFRVINPSDMTSQSEDTNATYYNLEEKIVSAIVNVTKEDVPLMYFITGHGETENNDLKKVFEDNGVTVKDYSIDIDTLDPTAKFMVIISPTRDYTTNELRKIEEFLSNNNKYGRHLMVFSSPSAPTLPRLEAFLKEWGIQFNKNMVYETSENSMQIPFVLVPQYAETEMGGTFINDKVPTIVPYARSLKALFQEKDSYTTSVLLKTSEGSYAKDSTKEQITYNKELGDAKGPFDVAVMSSRVKFENNEPLENLVFVSGSTEMLTSEFLTSYGNSEFLLAVFKRMLNDKDETVLNAVKTTTTSALSYSTKMTTFLAILLIGIIPGLVIIIGFVVFIRRRYL